MLKTLVNLFLVLGIVFFLIISRSVGEVFLGLAALGILISIAERKAEILDNWSALIRGARGQRDRVITTTKELISITKAPSIEMKEEKVGPGLAPSAFGETREFLIVADRRNLKLGNFKAYVNANDYGDGLFVSWYLTYMPDVWQILVSLIPGTRKAIGLDELNLFNKQDLTAYVTCVHHCLLEAVEKLMLDLNQDPSKVDRKTRGFLGIS
jgi:hypothetical protein